MDRRRIGQRRAAAALPERGVDGGKLIIAAREAGDGADFGVEDLRGGGLPFGREERFVLGFGSLMADVLPDRSSVVSVKPR